MNKSYLPPMKAAHELIDRTGKSERDSVPDWAIALFGVGILLIPVVTIALVYMSRAS